MFKTVLFLAVLLPFTIRGEPQRHWRTGVVVQAEELKRPLPHIEVLYPRLTHRYTIETGSEFIRATELAPMPDRVQWKPRPEPKPPELSFSLSQKVEVAISDSAPEPGKPRELYVRRSGKEHILTIDEIVPKRR